MTGGRWQKDKGDDYFVVSSATPTYPAGNGGSTTTQGSSIFALAANRALVLHSVLVTSDTDAEGVLLEDHDGNALMEIHAEAIRSVEVKPGILLGNGLRASITGGATASAMLTFRPAHD